MNCCQQMLASMAVGVGLGAESLKAKQLHINALELVTVLVALLLWAPQFRGRHMTLLCDNMTSVLVLNKGITGDSFRADCLWGITF